FSNSLGIEVDSIALADYMSTVEGISQIQSLSISYSSLLKDLKVVKAFPNLRYISVYGYQITSLDGLEWFQHGEYIDITTEKNRRRSITKISDAPIKRMSLHFARSEDLDDIAECLTLNYLEIFRSKDLEFSKWNRVPLESLGIKQGKFKELGNTAAIISLKDISVLGCRSLERFTGNNNRITRLLIDNCKKLDLQTIQTFQGLETLIVNGNPNEIGLTEIGELKQLKSLTLIMCNVRIDTSNLKRYFPRLEKLHISNMKKEQAIELSQSNPDIKFSGRSFKSV
ncbi:MAG: hypothetical protein WD424_00450, partial [Paenibacillaceae bacterium]